MSREAIGTVFKRPVGPGRVGQFMLEAKRYIEELREIYVRVKGYDDGEFTQALCEVLVSIGNHMPFESAPRSGKKQTSHLRIAPPQPNGSRSL